MLGFGALPMPLRLPSGNMEHFAKNKRNRTDSAGTSEDDHKQLVELSETPREQDFTSHNDRTPTRVHVGGSYHQRDLSLHVMWTLNDIRRVAMEVYDGTIADVHLSLLVYWIQEKDENYNLAKEHIRELSLDQGYNTERIDNIHLRKLLQDTHSIRPRYECDCPPGMHEADCLLDKHRREVLNVLSPKATCSRLPLITAGKPTNPISNLISYREPPFAKTARIQAQITTPRRKSTNPTSVASPLAARTDSLPLSFSARRKRFLKEAAWSSSVPFSGRDYGDYPPNTPDRPAPLAIRSCSSKASSAAHTSNNFPRSVSSPIHDRGANLDLIPLPRVSTMFQDLESCPLLSQSSSASIIASSDVVGDAGTVTDDVFGIVRGANSHQNEPFTTTRAISEANHQISSRGYPLTEPCDQHCMGPFELDDVDVASNSSYKLDEPFNSSQNQFDRGVESSGKAGDLSNDEALDLMEPYAGSDDEISILETASSVSDSENHAQYSYALPAPPSEPVVANTATTPSQCLSVTQVCREAQPYNLMANVPSFHRPLPLRSYESEAHLYPTSCAPGGTSHNRSNYATEGILRSSRPVPLEVELMRTTDAILLHPSSTAAPTQAITKPHQANHLPLRTKEQLPGAILGPQGLISLPPSFNATATEAIPPPLQAISLPPRRFDRHSEKILGPNELIPLPPQYRERHARAVPFSSRAEATHPHRATPLTKFTAAERIPLPPRSFLDVENSNSILPMQGSPISMEDQESAKRNEFEDPLTERSSRHLSTASTMAAFPVPSMQNPVGELPMAVSRAIPPPELAATSTSVAEAYRAITKAHITELLQRTRNRGTQLQVVEWNNLTAFERTWREVNEELLVSIHGRRDVLLTDADVEYIDSIATGLRGGEGTGSSADWLRQIFRVQI